MVLSSLLAQPTASAFDIAYPRLHTAICEQCRAVQGDSQVPSAASDFPEAALNQLSA